MARFERWLEVKRIFEEALEIAPDERAAFLDRSCGGDVELRREVEALLGTPAVSTSALASLLGMPGRQEEPDYAEGDRIDHFTIVRRVGQGGMGVVYEARDIRNNDRQVAIKVLFSRAVTLSQDKRLAGLSHPAIVTFHDSGATPEGLPYFVFEFIEGEPITAFTGRRQLSMIDRLRLFQKVCDAVSYAHQRGVIHCDLKPENILVTATGELKLLDFGIAREVGAEGTEVGEPSPITLPFASPEQIGNEETTTLSDVYSLGVLLAVLLTGRLPYRRARTASELRDTILHEQPSPPSKTVSPESVPLISTAPPAKSAADLARQLRGDLDAIIVKALRKEPAERYQSVPDLAIDISRYLGDFPVVARGDSRRYRFSKFLKRRRKAAAVAAAFLLLVLASLGLWLREYRRAVLGERHASAQAERTQQINRFVVDLLRRTNPYDPSSSPNASVDELLDQSSRTIETSLNSYPDLKASLLSVLGEIFLGRGDARRARGLLENALALQRRGPRDHALAETLYRYGVLLTGQGKYQDSEALLAEAREILGKLGKQSDPVLESRILLAQGANRLSLGDYEATRQLSQAAIAALRHSPGSFGDLAASLHGLGRALDSKDRDAEAEALFRQALSYAERVRDARNPLVATIANALGALLYKRGDYVNARKMYLRALDVSRTTLGESNREYALTLHNLAALDSVQGQYQKASEEFEQAVATLQKILPPNHVNILTTRDQLASALVQLHDYQRAERMFLGILSAERATLPKNHPLLGTTLNNLGYLYQDEGRLQESEASYQEALGIFEKLVGRKSRPVATLLGNLGNIAESRGDNRGAEMRFKEALDIARSVAKEKSPDTINAMSNLASLYIAMGEPQKARGLVSEVIPLSESMVGPKGRLTGSAYYLEAKLLLAEGDVTGAFSEARRARVILSANLPPQDWRIAAADSVIGASLGRSGDRREAEKLLLSSLTELRKVKGDQWPATREAMERVHSFYKSQGRDEEAKKYQRREGQQ